MHKYFYILVLFSLTLVVVLPRAHATDGELRINPLLSMRDQIKMLNKECAEDPKSEYCTTTREKLRDKIIALREMCRLTPNDDRCGSIMEEKKSSGWRIQEYCFANPYDKKCVRRRERSRRRERLKRKFCAKNPDSRRCFTSMRMRKKKGYGTLYDYCKDHPEKNKCKALREKINKGKPTPTPVANTF